MSNDVPAHGRTPLRYEAGDVVNGRYTVLEQLGSGASGAVYRIDDAFLDDQFALKVLDPSVDVGAVRREVNATWNVAHPNVARVFNIDQTATEPKCWLIVQELVDGCSLDSFGPRCEERLDLIDACDVIDQVLAALEAIHPDVGRIAELESREQDEGGLELDEFYELQDLKATGIVHRDVKPQNIRRRGDGVVKLIDFGIASAANSAVHTRSATPEYAPRDADLFQWKPAYDLFAVGVIAFELLTGTSPFVDGLPALGRTSKRCGTANLPAPLLQVIERAINDDPRERFDDATTMRNAFAAISIDPDDECAESPGQGSPVAEAATAAGMGDLYRRAIDIARRRHLGVREYKRSLMITPGRNRSRYLVNLAFHPDHCGVGVSPPNWTSFFDIEEGSVLDELDVDHSSNMGPDELGRFLDRLDAVLTATSPIEPDDGSSPARQIVDFLERHPGTHGIEDIAHGTGLGHGTVRRRVSTLTTESCSATLRGRVTRKGRNAYSATAADATRP